MYRQQLDIRSVGRSTASTTCLAQDIQLLGSVLTQWMRRGCCTHIVAIGVVVLGVASCAGQLHGVPAEAGRVAPAVGLPTSNLLRRP